MSSTPIPASFARVREVAIEAVVHHQEIVEEVEQRTLVRDDGPHLLLMFERVELRLGRDQRSIGGDQDPLTAAVEQRHVPERVPQRVHDRREITAKYVVQLHPLLEDAALREPALHEIVVLVAVEVRGSGEPDARQLHADEVVALLVHEEEVAPVTEVQSHARIVEGTEVARAEVCARGLDDRGRDLDHVEVLPGVRGQGTERGPVPSPITSASSCGFTNREG